MVYNEKLKREIPKGWEVVSIGSILGKIKSTARLATEEYLSIGLYPIIDQSTDKYFAGFTNKTDAALEEESVVVFGDHSCTVKYVNFPFVRGADGTQIMKSINPNISTEYLYFAVKGVKIGKGYARHFTFLKDSLIIVPNEKVAKNFSEIASKIFKKITIHRKSNFLLTKQRDELLPLLMNGQVSVMPTEVNCDLSHD